MRQFYHSAVAERSFAWPKRTGVGAPEREKERAVASSGVDFYDRITPGGLEDQLPRANRAIARSAMVPFSAGERNAC